MDIKQAFGKALKEIRLSKGISQEKMVGAASRVYISSLERGLRNPSLSTVDEIARELGVHPMELLFLTYTYKDNAESRSLLTMLETCAEYH